MCLPGFVEFKDIPEATPLIGYRNWNLNIKSGIYLLSEHQVYEWNKKIEGPHLVLDKNSGIYSYNYNNYYNYYNYNNYYNYKYYKYYKYYNLGGIIHQWGRVAIHTAFCNYTPQSTVGYRSEYAKLITLFTIKEPFNTANNSESKQRFLDWIKKFNERIERLVEFYKCKTVHWQDYKDEYHS